MDGARAYRIGLGKDRSPRQKMGEAKRKSRKREEVIKQEPRCIYCPGPVETWEHMPPISMFRGRLRPSGMEYAACNACNEGTRGADTVAAVIARVRPSDREGSWKEAEIRKHISALDAYAPGVREELSLPSKIRPGWVKMPNGLFRPVVQVTGDGPLLKAHLGVFGAKLAMALFREHVGAALPLDGAVWCQFRLNGMTQEYVDELVAKMPLHGTLEQGRKNVGDQFAYRFNHDGRSTFAALVQFHHGIWYTTFASSDQNVIALFRKPQFLSLPGALMAMPGKLLSLLPTAP